MRAASFCFFFILWGTSCTQKNDIQIDVQGHRGCRGLMPENTIPAFLHAISLGVNTLEMDVVINADGKVIVSHEPFYNPDFTTFVGKDQSVVISDENTNIFHMSEERMNLFDVGVKRNARFPEQRSIPAFKPTLDAVIEVCIDRDVFFNIEIKRTPEQDGIFHPNAEEFVERVLQTIEKHGVIDRTTIQSFDLETLKIVKEKNNSIKLALLCDDYWVTFGDKVSELGFLPEVYSPHYLKVSKPLIRNCAKKGVKVIPWTVNSVPLMRKLIYWGVDGIITDYPDRLIETLEKM